MSDQHDQQSNPLDQQSNPLEAVQAWAERSRRGECCGILGCAVPAVILNTGTPAQRSSLTRCERCQNHYCSEHAKIHAHLGVPKLDRRPSRKLTSRELAGILAIMGMRPSPGHDSQERS